MPRLDPSVGDGRPPGGSDGRRQRPPSDPARPWWDPQDRPPLDPARHQSRPADVCSDRGPGDRGTDRGPTDWGERGTSDLPPRPPRAVSSAQAIKHAVSSLYRLDDFSTEPLGSGFFSQVYKVTHKTTNQVMVLKMNVNFNNRPNMLREVQMMNRLGHPNILRFMGVCVHEGQLHALTEYIDGGCLEDLLADSDREIPWDIRLKLAADLAKGLRYLHSRRIIHRDLTSKNVLIRGRGLGLTAVIGDFGLSCKLPDPRVEKDKPLPIVGSPYWMAPECINGNVYNEKADVFSYGIILCEIIARVEADPDVLPRTRHFGVDYVAFSKMIPELPQEYLGFLHLALNCCQIDPKKRQSMSEIVNLLEELKSKSQMAAVLADINSLHLEDQESVSKRELDRRLGSRRKKSLSRPPSVTIEPAKEMSPPRIDLLPELTAGLEVEDLTPQVVAEIVSQQDEFYTPHRDNPFTARFTNATTKLVGSLRENWQDWFELPSPSGAHTPPTAPSTPDPRTLRSLRRCHSLPESPAMMRREFDRYDGRCLLYSAQRRLEDDLYTAGDDSFDACSEGSSSTDSGILDFRRPTPRSLLHTDPANLRKKSMDAGLLGASMERYRGYRGRRPRSWMAEDFLCSASSSDLEDAFVMSPSSSYSSYSDLDSELLHLSVGGGADLRRARFQQLVDAWEAKHKTLLSPPPSFRPRSLLTAKDSANFYLDRVRKFQELRHKWETQQQQLQQRKAAMAARERRREQASSNEGQAEGRTEG